MKTYKHIKKNLTKAARNRVYDKFEGRCAYSGTPLEDDWQVDHVIPVVRVQGVEMFPNESEDNLVPTQKLINHYKGSMLLSEFRNERLAKMHYQLRKLPKNPRVEKSKRRIKYMNTIASYFNITPYHPFDGLFYFEKIKAHKIETGSMPNGFNTEYEKEYFEWAAKLYLALGKQMLIKTNNRLISEGKTDEWPALQEWSELSGSSAQVFLNKALEEAGIAGDRFRLITTFNEDAYNTLIEIIDNENH